MVWHCVSVSGIGDLLKTDGNMTTKNYSQHVINHALLSGEHLIDSAFLFQHGNDPDAMQENRCK